MTNEDKVEATKTAFAYTEELFNNTSRQDLDYLSILSAFQAGYEAGFKKAMEKVEDVSF